jgi:hypothetical protein
MEEIWKDIEGYERYYQVSNFGRVKSLERIVKHSKGGKKIVKERILNNCICGSGYYTVLLAKEGVNKRIMNHVLVAKSFLKNPNNKRTVNHIDCNKLNNNLSNLEFSTDSENQIHASKNGLKPKGEKHVNSKIKSKDVLYIRNSSKTCKELGEMFNISFQTVSKIKLKKTWKHL